MSQQRPCASCVSLSVSFVVDRFSTGPDNNTMIQRFVMIVDMLQMSVTSSTNPIRLLGDFVRDRWESGQ